jgi:hypothetical protein
LDIELLGEITAVETIATGRQIRELDRLKKVYGPGRWRKRKGVARVRLPDGTTVTAEVHWYEAHGLGRQEFKLKRVLGT